MTQQRLGKRGRFSKVSPRFPRELHLLLAFCRASMDQDVGRRIRTLTSGQLNWKAFEVKLRI